MPFNLKIRLPKGVGEHLASVDSLNHSTEDCRGLACLHGTCRITLPTLGAKRKLSAKRKCSAERSRVLQRDKLASCGSAPPAQSKPTSAAQGFTRKSGFGRQSMISWSNGPHCTPLCLFLPLSPSLSMISWCQRWKGSYRLLDTTF